MKVWKRCLTALLTLILIVSDGSVSLAAGTLDTGKNIWRSTAAEIVAEYYGMEDKEAAILCCDAVDNGRNYYLSAPYQNKEDDPDNLVAVDYLTQTVYAKKLETNGHVWIPAEAVVVADGEEQERFSLTQGTFTYNNFEYHASNAFTYSGNRYTVNVFYQVTASISQAEQERLLQIPAILAQIAENLEVDLKGMRLNLKYFGQMIPYLQELLSMQVPVTKKVPAETLVSQDAEEASSETSSNVSGESVSEEPVTVTVYEPAFDPEEDQEVIAAVQALYALYMADPANPSLPVMRRTEEYRATSKACLSYAMKQGEALIAECTELYRLLEILDNSSKLTKAIRKAKEVDPELYGKLQYFNSYLKDFLGSARKPGPLVRLSDRENWKFLDPAVQNRILRPVYTTDAFNRLESLVYALRNEDIATPAFVSDKMIAAEVEVGCSVLFWHVNVTVKGDVYLPNGEEPELVELPERTCTIKLLNGATEAEILDAINATGLEASTLESWNALDPNYQISIAKYDRDDTGIPGTLKQDLNLTISYTPRQYKVKTNYDGTYNVYFGTEIDLPAHSDKESSYDYMVKDADGSIIVYEQGVTYRVTKDVAITRKEGTAKTAYRLYDLIARDDRYGLDPVAQSILGNSAVNSPVLNIRVPDSSVLPSVTEKDGVYSLKIRNYYSGIAGMYWEPTAVRVMNGKKVVEEVPVIDNMASWTTPYTYVDVSYTLKVKRVKDGLINRELKEEEDILYALNLPKALMEDAVKTDQLLHGEDGITAAKIQGKLGKVGPLLTPVILESIQEYMVTEDGKNAIIRLLGSEDTDAKNDNNSNLGQGGWSSNSEELAINKYLGTLVDADWSLAVYYKDNLYKELQKQCRVLASCLQGVVNDPGLDVILKEVGPAGAGKKEELQALVPELLYLADHITEPHKDLNMESPDFSRLMEQLLEVDGSAGDYTESFGLYTNTSVQKTTGKNGSLKIYIKLGNATAEITSIHYDLDSLDKNGYYHELTEAEIQTIQEDTLRLEESLGLTAYEKKFYDCEHSTVPGAGDRMETRNKITYVYTPKKYTVTIHGVEYEQYHAEFYYGSDYCIELPPRSHDSNDPTFYRYTIKGEEKDVSNGTTKTYRFAKEDLLTLFATGNYEITRKEVAKQGEESKEDSKDNSKDKNSSSSASDKKGSSSDEKKKEDEIADGKVVVVDSDVKELEEALEELPIVTEMEEKRKADVEKTDGSLSELFTGNTRWILLAVAVLLLLGVSAAVWYFMRKRKRRKNNFDGAPMVDYEISDDDE